MSLLALSLMLLLGIADEPPVPPERLPLVTHWYDPALGGTNCDPGGGCSTFGSGQVIQDHHYNWAAACLTEWRGKTVNIPGFGSFVCLDSGGSIKPTLHPEHGWIVYMDILSRDPVQVGPWHEWWFEGEGPAERVSFAYKNSPLPY